MGVARVARRSLVVDPATGGSAAPHGGTAVATHSAKAKAKAVLFAWDPANKEDREAAAAKLEQNTISGNRLRGVEVEGTRAELNASQNHIQGNGDDQIESAAAKLAHAAPSKCSV